MIKKILITILLLSFFIAEAQQNERDDDIVQITLQQKQEILDFDYTSYQGNQKTIGEFLLEVPYVNNIIYTDIMYFEPHIGRLRGLSIMLETTDGNELEILLYSRSFQFMQYDDASTWTMALLEQETIDLIEVLDHSLYSPLVLHID